MVSLPLDSSLFDSAALSATIEPPTLPVASIDANAPKAGVDLVGTEGAEAMEVVTAVTLDIAKGFGFVPLLRGIAPNNPPDDDDAPKSGVSLEEAVLLPKPKPPSPKADPNNGFDIDEVEDKSVANEFF